MTAFLCIESFEKLCYFNPPGRKLFPISAFAAYFFAANARIIAVSSFTFNALLGRTEVIQKNSTRKPPQRKFS